jgi:hypothetical protein
MFVRTGRLLSRVCMGFGARRRDGDTPWKEAVTAEQQKCGRRASIQSIQMRELHRALLVNP